MKAGVYRWTTLVYRPRTGVRNALPTPSYGLNQEDNHDYEYR